LAISIERIDAEQALPVRHRVLWPDRPIDYCRLDEDGAGWHFGAFKDGVLVCVASVFIEQDQARLRKFATLPEYQSRGIGSAMLTHILAQLRDAGIRRIWCEGRQSAAGFYRRFGMAEEGQVFFKGDIPYVRMAGALS
jgi:GNAT superfamily N-acetyltransferase